MKCCVFKTSYNVGVIRDGMSKASLPKCMKKQQNSKQAGTGPKGASLKFLKYAKNTIFKLLPVSQCRKYPKG